MSWRNVFSTVVMGLAIFVTPSMAQETLGDLVASGGYDWIMGRWVAGPDDGQKVEFTFDWALDKHVVLNSLQIGDFKHPSGTEYKKLLYQIRPAFGGNIIATIVNPLTRPQMATVREGVMPIPPVQDGRKGEIVVANPDLNNLKNVTRILSREKTEKKVNLKAARIIVAGGYGVGSRENFKHIWSLAGVLGAEVGASRAAVDAGFIEKDHQVGQTGTTVRPVLYIACGISGSVQHRAGMDQSAKIVAINSDPGAPILGVAHYGIIGDLNTVIPMIIDDIKKRRVD